MRYEVKALHGNDQVTALALDAVDAVDAASQARDQGYTVIAIRAKAAWPVWRRPGGSFPLILFSQELLALLEAGLSLVESLETLAEKEQQSDIRKTLTQIIASLYEGHTFSHALQHSPAHFPLLYVATVRACEKTGALPEALSRYVAYQSQMDAVKRQVVSASIYPLLLAGVGGLVTLFLMVYVVPRFSHIYADIGGGNLPLMSRLLMRWGELLDVHGAAILGGTLLVLAAIAYTVTRPASKLWLMRKLCQVPSLGRRLHVYQLARFYRSLGMLLRGGMPVVTSLQMVSDLLDASLRGQLALALSSVREGRALSRAMEQYGLTTPVALRMLRVGERTGRMGEMMERIAAFYEEETARWVERFTKLFEPLLMVFIGLVIGGIVVLMYFPIFDLAGSIQ